MSRWVTMPTDWPSQIAGTVAWPISTPHNRSCSTSSSRASAARAPSSRSASSSSSRSSSARR
ncbi:hypothetical protein KGD82_06765 [Nocardiopsis eucommiae]|uniref:Uncharacterized protein n=1 Tax=Nocardiopsis eucommiae TaxID=2831970 RepID=A0A975LAZ7_9ACTN|nr:hypothetical protein KGD82_06765 [Nocardiopsis eucommiae]